jgi:hypothetical protein
MGNCATCCGKADTNEVVTEKHQLHQTNSKLKGGVSSEAPGGYENPLSSKRGKFHPTCVHNQKKSHLVLHKKELS